VPTDAPVWDVTGGAGPFVFRLHANTPNPFVTSTAIAFTLPRDTHVVMRVYDLAGRRVRQLLDRRLETGRHQVAWDGRDESGRRAAHGIYLLRLEAGELRANRKIAFVP
jgi:flagellar hook assembly protein FlgD